MVLGPASDGGYYLIGLKQPRKHLFTQIGWGTEAVARNTRKRANEIGVAGRCFRNGTMSTKSKRCVGCRTRWPAIRSAFLGADLPRGAGPSFRPRRRWFCTGVPGAVFLLGLNARQPAGALVPPGAHQKSGHRGQ
jgi:hypothetical protein